MAELKTKPHQYAVADYLKSLSDEKKIDAIALIEMMQEITSEPAIMWGSSIIGFGQKRFHYASGREIDYFLLGFSMRKHAITLYLSISINQNDFQELGPHTKGVGCLYIKTLSEVNVKALKTILDMSWLEAKNA